MAGGVRRVQLLYHESDESGNKVWNVKHELEGWREVLLPLAYLLRWDQPYYPIVIVGSTTFLFSFIWYTGMSTLTAVSLACMFVAIFDFIIPIMGPTITGTKIWTSEDESEFIYICKMIACFHQDILETWHGLKVLRHENTRIFFFIVIGVLVVTAWVGSMVSNFFLAYLTVTGVFLTPGLRYHGVTHRYVQLMVSTFNKLKTCAIEKRKFS